MNEKWYLARPGGAAVGPVGTDVLVRRIREGTVSREALVWRQGMPKWLPLGAVKELGDAVRSEARPASAQRDERAPATTRLPFKEDDADEKTELAISMGPGAPSSGPTVIRPAAGHAARVDPPGANPTVHGPFADPSPRVYGGNYDLPDSVTKIVDPGRGGQHMAPTLPAAGVPSPAGQGAAGYAVPAGIANAPASREAMPTRLEPLNQPEAAARIGTASPPASPLPGGKDEEVPPPYPPGFPGPEAQPIATTPPTVDDPVSLPMASSNVGIRIAVAVVFIVGLAIGIFGARRVVLMRQAAQEDKAGETH
jgi:hypothetical protein